ncbi:MAG: hypothetical protein RR290_03110 [Clostridia bacterium]
MNILLNRKTISVSILDVKDVESFLKKMCDIKAKLNLDNIIIHFDVMDGDFVLANGIDLNFTKLALKYQFFIDVHLMVSDPEMWIKKAYNLGANNITIHYESENLYKNLELLNEIKKEADRPFSIGISVKPDTDVRKLFNYSKLCDLILVMSVEPGYGGQTYMNKVNEKISIAKNMNKIVQIDGGINIDTITNPCNLGVDSFVIGSYFTKDSNELEIKISQIENVINGVEK